MKCKNFTLINHHAHHDVHDRIYFREDIYELHPLELQYEFSTICKTLILNLKYFIKRNAYEAT